MFLPTVLRAFFLLSSATVIFIHSLPAFRVRFLAYGKTASAPIRSSSSSQNLPKANVISRFLDYLSTLTVPHAYFTHFYLFSVLNSQFWFFQKTTHGSAYVILRDLRAPAWWPDKDARSGGQAIHQVVLTCLCFFLHSCRRLYECLVVQRQGSGSRMWVVHYLLGGVFYLAMGIGVWIEGTDAIDGFDFSLGKVYALVGPPSAKSFAGVLLFIMGSGLQFDCHAYLASLEKYTLPVHPAFQKLVCPHYFAECLIYVGFAIMSAPRGRGPVNVTVMTALVFSAVNLGVTSLVNREWYEGKFGKKAVEGKWNIVPLVF